MKKIIFTGFLILLVTGAFGISVGAFLEGGIQSYTEKFELDADSFIEASQTDTLIGFGIFADATYVRLAISYAMSLGATAKARLVLDGDEVDSITADSPDGYSWTFLNIYMLGKYPINLASMTIWPTAGILYSLTLSMDFDGDGVADDLTDMAVNDLYISAGCGADIPISGNLFVTSWALFSYNLTPVMFADVELPPDQSLTWYRITAFVGVGYNIP